MKKKSPIKRQFDDDENEDDGDNTVTNKNSKLVSLQRQGSLERLKKVDQDMVVK